jgi:NTP pyrophosphatase (non-canonical NTP hydrolase)
MTIAQAQKMVDDWIKKYGIRYFNELTNMALLTEEVGEVARIVARNFGEQTQKTSENTGDLADELADVLFVLICMANQTGTDLEDAFLRNIEKKTTRDYNRHTQNKKLK